MKQFKTVFLFEYTNYIKSKGYIITTVLMLALIIVITSLPTINGVMGNLFGGSDGKQASGEPGAVAANLTPGLIIDKDGIYADDILASYLPGFTFNRADGVDDPEALITSGEYQLILVIDGLDYMLYEKNESMLSMGHNDSVSAMVRNVYQTVSLSEYGVNQADAAKVINAIPNGTVVSVGTDIEQSFWLSYIMVILMYMVIMLYGQFVMTSTVIEKTTKAMELLITSAKPFQLMFGKVMGVGAAGLTQFGLILLTALGFFKLSYGSWVDFSPMVASILDMSISGSLVFYAVLFFLLGFFSFSFVYAGLGSTVSRMEDAQSTQIIPMMLFVAAFMVAIFGSMTPDAGYVHICSFIPFLSPMVMFMRICTLGVPPIEIIIAIIVNVATVFGAAFVCSRIYKVGVMLYGKKPNIVDIIRYVRKA